MRIPAKSVKGAVFGQIAGWERAQAATAFTEFADTQGSFDFSAIYKTLRALPERD